ncbi:MAG: LysM peptidoglycan-binding domain-containing protein, partial [Anaerolineales bacterium]|nr:LysM peptidoglycan-binding domain-containing protein [Anaerolineales bacterium]
AIAYFYFYGNIPLTASEPAPGPAVTIQEPVPGAQVTKGDSFVFFATANDEVGVVRLDLWVDSTLVLSQSSPDASGLSPLSLSYPLVAAENGTYALIARAYNSQGEFGESVVHYVTVVEPAASAPTQEYAQYIVQEGDTLENIAARLGVSVEDILAANPGLSVGQQLQPGQVLIIPMPKAPAQVAVPGPNGVQPVAVPGPIQKQPAPNPPNPPPPANQPSLTIKGLGVLTSPVFYGQSCTTEPLTTDVVATVDPPSAVKTATVKYAYYGKAGSSPVLTVPMVSTGGSNFGANINAGGEAVQYLAQDGGAAVVWVEVVDTNAQTSVSQSVTLTVSFCPSAGGPLGNLPGILPQFLPGGGVFGQLDPNLFPPSLFPAPKNVVFNPPNAEVTAPGSLSATANSEQCTIMLTWLDSDNETRYQVDRYEFGKPSPVTVATLKANATTYQETLPKIGKFGYRVLAQREEAGKKSPQAPSPLVWAELVSSQKCQPIPEFKRAIFQPLNFRPSAASLTHGHLRIAIGGLPAFRIPRPDQVNVQTGDWSTRPRLSVPAPESVYTHPSASLRVQVHADGTSNPQTVPVKSLGTFYVDHTAADLTNPNASQKIWYGKGGDFELWYKFWLEDWLWDGKDTNPALPVPHDVKVDLDSWTRYISWKYNGSTDNLDYFIVYRQYNCPGGNTRIEYPLVAEKSRLRANLDLDVEPVGCSCIFQVSAFGNGGESNRSEPTQGTCETKKPTDAVEITFSSMTINPDLVPKPTSGQVHIFANEVSKHSNEMVLEGRTYSFQDIHLGGITNNNNLFVVLKNNGSSLAVNLNFYVSNLCQGTLTVKKLGFDWKNVEGFYTIKSPDGNCEVVVSLKGSPVAEKQPVPGGGTCDNNHDCESWYCDMGICAPMGQGDSGNYCFANYQCLSKVCDCVEDNKLVPCGLPKPGMTGSCAPGTANGESCKQDNDCASEHCAEGLCAPQNGLGKLGSYCHNDNHCATGACYCPSGKAIGFYPRFCQGFESATSDKQGSCSNFGGKKTNGEACTSEDECASVYCAENKCAPRNGTGLSGAYCHHNDHCYSRICECQKIMGSGFCINYQDFTSTNHATCAP